MARVGFIGLGIMGDPMSAAAHQLFSIARERGFGDHDISAVLRALTAR